MRTLIYTVIRGGVVAVLLTAIVPAYAASLSFASKSPTPTPAAGLPNDLVTLNIVIDSVAGLTSATIEGVDWTLTYDSSLLVVDSDSDISLVGTKFEGATALANRTAGQIKYAIAPTTAPTLVDGDVISSISFQIKGDATAGALANVALTEIIFNEADEILNGAQANVQVVPVPATAALFLTAFGGLGFIPRVFRRRAAA